jgi:hypothetical protein
MKIKWGIAVLVATGIMTASASASEPVEPAWVAENTFEFTALGDATPADPIDTGEIAEEIAAVEAAHEEEISSPAAETEREESRDAFEDLGPQEARQLIKDAFEAQLEALTTLPTEPLLESETPVDFISDSVARIDPPGSVDSLLVVSDTPLRNDDGEIVAGELTTTSGGFEPAAPLAEVELPDMAAGEVVFEEVDVSFGFEGADPSQGRLISAAEGDGKEMVFFANTATDTDTAITYNAFGIETFTYLRSERSPETVSLDYTLPGGAELSKTPDGGAVITGSGGEVLVSVFPPYAVDAQGSFVPMSLSVEGESLVMDVPHRGRDFAYPIMVDPVQHVRDWWTNGSGAGYEGWSFHEAGSTNYLSSTSCPSAVLPADPCGGTGAGVYVSAQPGKSYPADSKGYWRWTAPGGASSSITGATLSSWRYRKGGASNGNPYAFFNLSTAGTGFTTNVGGGGSGVNLTGSGDATKYLHVGLASTSSVTMPTGNANWRYNRLAGYSLSMTDGEPPSLNLSGAPAGWIGPNAPFSVTAAVHDPGLGMGSINAQVNGTWTGKWAGWCWGTYPYPCPNWPLSASLSFNSNDFPNGLNLVPVKAADIVAGDGHETTSWFAAKVDRSGPTISTSGPLSTQNGAGDALVVQIDDHALSNPSFGSGGDLDPAPAFADYLNLRSGAKEFKLFVDDQLVLSRSRSCSSAFGSCRLGPESVSPNLSSFPDGSHEFKLVATDQVGNSTTKTWQKVLDKTQPTIHSATAPATWQTGEVDIGVRAVDGQTGISSIEVEDQGGIVAVRFLDCGGSGGCPSSFDGTVAVSAENLREGENVLSVYVIDRSGRRSEPKLVFPELDKVAPQVWFMDAPAWASESARLVVSASNQGSGVARLEVADGSGAVTASRQLDCSASCPAEVEETFTADLSQIEAGPSKALKAIAISAAGTRTEAAIAVGIERTPPALQPLSGTLPALEGQVTDSSAVKTVLTGALDSLGSLASGVETVGIRDHVGGWSSEVDCSSADCSSVELEVPLAELLDANHGLVAYAIDRAGNEATETIEFTLDRSGPTIAIGTKADPDDGVRDNGEDLDFWVSSSDVPERPGSLAEVEVQVNGQAVEPEPCAENCSVESYRVEGAEAGSHLVAVEASDSLGHFSELTREILLDSDPPEIELGGDLVDGAEVSEGAQTLDVATSDPQGGTARSGIAELTIEIDGTTVREVREPCATGDCELSDSYSFEEDELGLGTHEITVRAADQAGNSSQELLTVTRSCAASPPTVVDTDDPISPSAAVSNVETHHPDVVAASEESEASGRIYEPTVTEDSGALLSEQTREPSELPDRDNGATIAGSQEQAVCLVADSISDEAGEPEIVNEDSALYPNTAQDTDTVVRPTIDGAETFDILRGPDAPEDFGWEIASPSTETLSQPSADVVSVTIDGSELAVSERPDPDPAFEGDAQSLVQTGELPAGTVDASDDPVEAAAQAITEQVSQRPVDSAIATALPAGGPASLPSPPTPGDPEPSDLPEMLDNFEQAASAEEEQLATQALADYRSVDAAVVAQSDAAAAQVAEDELEEIRGEDHEIARVEAPAAIDASGVPVPIELAVDSDRIEISVDHVGSGFDYPIAVDPFVTVYSTVVDWEAYPVYRDERYVSGSSVTLRQIGWWDSRFCAWINCSAEQAAPGWFEVADRFRAWLPGGLALDQVGPLYQAFYEPVYSTRSVFDRWEYKPVVRQVSSLDWEDAGATVSAPLGVPPVWDRGMNFVGFDRSAFDAGANNGSIDAARNQLGIKTAVLVPHWYTRTGGSSNIFRTGKTPTDSGLKAIARHARNELGMKVVIKPHVDSRDETWRGEMQFSNRNAFWNDYTRIMLNHAEIADQVNAHGLVIGTELSKVQDDQPREWRSLIGRVRNRFDGMLYYAANWDTVLSVGAIPDWFGLLDVIGIDYYRDNSNRSASEMWDRIVDIRRRFGTGVVLTESGGNSRGNQILQYRATNDAMLEGRNKAWFKGIWWYNRFTFTQGGYGKTWNEFTPNKSTSKWLCKKQTRKSDRECERLIDRVW